MGHIDTNLSLKDDGIMPSIVLEDNSDVPCCHLLVLLPLRVIVPI